MCNSRNSKKILVNGKTIRVDRCLQFLIPILNDTPLKTLGACCGHYKYQATIIVKNNDGKIFELMSGKNIPRKKRFYVKDKNGLYFVPETIE